MKRSMKMSYVKPQSTVLSINISENIAASTTPVYFWLKNVNTGFFMNTTLSVEEYTNLEVFEMLFAGTDEAFALHDCLIPN